jgi:hypothetical protein
MEPEFEALWARHETRTPSGHPITFRFTAVGPIELRYQTFDLPGTGGQSLGMYVPAPGGPSAERLQLLSLLADGTVPQSDRAAPRKSGGTPSR